MKLNSLSHIITKKIISQWISGDFPGGLAVKSLSASVGDTGSIPGPGNKITRAVEQRSPRTTTTEPKLWSPCAAAREATAPRSPRITARAQPPLVKTRESLGAPTKTQCSQK